MAALDWVFLAVLAFSLLLGVLRGLVYEVLSVLSWIVAFVLAQWLAPVVGGWLPMSTSSEPLRYAAGFAAVFVAAVFTGALLAWAVRKLVEAVGLRPVDRVLGGAFGLLRGVVLLLALAVVVNMTPLRADAWWTESVGAGVSTTALKGLKPVLPEAVGQYLPD
ncbi:MAG TPA: CvpA family protein [Ramlibacter sp.]|jgi:membrane protein required for colicin V production|uniref:CvpA family protein n=1 Tax=Ramlibacter sp. TaxID=1917967 RepID=UPI002D2BFC06|nr:CvpA family protein [Ramlibacter sp.]HZY19101.1 CvpA family protein [Ramlibacter sp.]